MLGVMTKALIIGGSSGMGKELARLLLADGMDVTIAGRNAARLAAARADLEHGTTNTVEQVKADIARDDEVAALFDKVGPLDHVVVTAADVTGVYGPTEKTAASVAQSVIATKVLGAWLVGKYAAQRVSGSITFTSGINAYRPNGSNTIVAAANGSLVSLASGLALELAPVRVNVVSPGWVDTPIWENLGVDKRTAFPELAARLPARRIGTPNDIAQAFRSVMQNSYITGTVVHVDGGHRLI